MSRRPRRWRPRGPGWRCIFDAGHAALWLRLEPDRSVTAIVYVGYGEGARYHGIWTLRCERGANILYHIIDKPHRVAWVLDHEEDGADGRRPAGRRGVRENGRA